MTTSEINNTARFIDHLEQSETAVWTVAQWLHSLGYNVQVNTAPILDDHKNWKSYADMGDISIAQRVEVKQLGVNFTNSDDFPFAPKFIVCARHAWDNARPKPYAYIILSKDSQTAAIVYGSTHEHWGVERRRDSRYVDFEQDFYFCPLSLVKFINLNGRV